MSKHIKVAVEITLTYHNDAPDNEARQDGAKYLIQSMKKSNLCYDIVSVRDNFDMDAGKDEDDCFVYVDWPKTSPVYSGQIDLMKAIPTRPIPTTKRDTKPEGEEYDTMTDEDKDNLENGLNEKEMN